MKYGQGCTGNVCTEDLVSLFESLGVQTGLDLEGLVETARFCEKMLGRRAERACDAERCAPARRRRQPLISGTAYAGMIGRRVQPSSGTSVCCV